MGNSILNLQNKSYDRHLRKNFNKYRNKRLLIKTKNSYVEGILKNFYIIEICNRVVDSCFNLIDESRLFKIFGQNVDNIYLVNRINVFDLVVNDPFFKMVKDNLIKRLNNDVFNIILEYLNPVSNYKLITNSV
tara:strand:+ start:632 stop:1030 length:399 start_codon:yes stop_codon:yes gene_type:complete